MQRIEKPWGYELLWALTDQYAGKRLHIYAGHRLSLQYHVSKVETILVERGELALELFVEGGAKTLVLCKDESYHIPAGMIHRMRGVTDVDVIEVSTSELEDVVRIEDDYGRVRDESGGDVVAEATA